MILDGQFDRVPETTIIKIPGIVIFDFHLALGQFLNYRLALQMKEPDRRIYLAVPLDTFNSFFQEIFVQEAIKIYQIKLIIYEPNKEEIVEWIE